MTLTQEQRIANLEAAISSLEAGVGNDYKNPRIGEADFISRGPPSELPNGDYNLFYWMRTLAIRVYEYAQDIKGMRAELAARPAGSVTSAQVLPLVPANGAVTGLVRPRNVTSVHRPDAIPLPVAHYFSGNAQFEGKVSIGGPPVQADPQLQIHGRGSAELLCITNEAGLDAQNPANRHATVFKAGNDGSAGIIQGGYWDNGTVVRPDLTRPLTTLHFDSVGTLSLSQTSPEEFAAGTAENSQLLVIEIDRATRTVIASVKKAGWGIAVAGNTDTGNNLNNNGNDRKAVLVEPLG